MALVIGMLVGTSIGIGIGNSARKRMDRWSPCYLCLFGRTAHRGGHGIAGLDGNDHRQHHLRSAKRHAL
jgi:hypothetical protein